MVPFGKIYIPLHVCPWSGAFGIFFISVPLPQMNSKTNRHLVVYFENQILQGAQCFQQDAKHHFGPTEIKGELRGVGRNRSSKVTKDHMQ